MSKSISEMIADLQKQLNQSSDATVKQSIK